MIFWVGILIVGSAIGLVLGLTGAGGSVLAVPLLILLLGLPAANAMGLALGAVAVAATYGAFLQRKNILWVPGITLAVAGSLTAPLGKFTSLQINEGVLLSIFSILAISIALKMWRQAVTAPSDTTHVRAGVEQTDASPQLCSLSATGQFQLRPKCLSGLALGGLVIGFISGLLGVGGGFLIVPLLLYLSLIPMVRAVATSLLVIALISGSGFISHLFFKSDTVSQEVFWLVGASLVGMFFSRKLSQRLAGPNLQRFFSITLILVLMATLANY